MACAAALVFLVCEFWKNLIDIFCVPETVFVSSGIHENVMKDQKKLRLVGKNDALL